MTLLGDLHTKVLILPLSKLKYVSVYPSRFGLNRGDRFPASEQEVVSLAAFKQGLADGVSRSSDEIDLGPILNDPAGLLKEEINLLPSPLFGSHDGASTTSGARISRLELQHRIHIDATALSCPNA
jgi:hypothetical protein